MILIKFLNDYPVATEIIREHFLKKMKQSLDEDDVSEEFKIQMLQRGVPDETIVQIIENTPRLLFDVMDENNILISFEANKELGYRCKINENNWDKWHSDRTTAEKNIIIDAIMELK